MEVMGLEVEVVGSYAEVMLPPVEVMGLQVDMMMLRVEAAGSHAEVTVPIAEVMVLRLKQWASKLRRQSSMLRWLDHMLR